MSARPGIVFTPIPPLNGGLPSKSPLSFLGGGRRNAAALIVLVPGIGEGSALPLLTEPEVEREEPRRGL